MTTRTITAAILLILCIALLVGATGIRRGPDRPGTGRIAATATPSREAYPAPGKPDVQMSFPYPPYTPVAYPYPGPVEYPTPWWTPLATKTPVLPTPAPVPTCPDAANPDCG